MISSTSPLFRSTDFDHGLLRWGPFAVIVCLPGSTAFFAPVKMVGIVGKDFPKKYISLYKKHKIDLEGLQIADGETFHWSGEYEVNMNNRRTLLATFAAAS